MPSPAAPLPPPLALAPARAATCKCKQRDEREPQLYIKCMWRRCADICLRVGRPTTRSPRAHFHAMILFLQQFSPFRSPFRRGGRERGHPSGNPAAKQLLAESAPSSIPIPPSFLPSSLPPSLRPAPCFISPYQIGIEVCFSFSFDSDSAIPHIIKIGSEAIECASNVGGAASTWDRKDRQWLFVLVSPLVCFPAILRSVALPTRACIHTYYPVCFSVCLSYWLLCSRQGQLSRQRAP